MTDLDEGSRIAEDEFLSALYALSYKRLRHLIGESPLLNVVEIGAGQCMSRLSGHDWIFSDVRGCAPLDLLNMAEALPYRASSLDGIVLKDTWHHIPDIERFLEEAHRALKPHGVIAVFDPYWSALARFVYRFLHQEKWDSRTPTWSFISQDPWDSNQALTYLMLKRDRTLFESKWGSQFRIVESVPLVGPSFLLSGGVSRRTFVGGRVLKQLLDVEERLGSWFNVFRMFHIFGLVKR